TSAAPETSVAPEPSATPGAIPDPPLLDDAGEPLPQTEDEPKQDALFDQRVQALWAAIVADDASLAKSFFFPVEAYEQVKAIPKPAADWQHRLWAHFERDIHQYHQQLGKDRARTKVVRVEIRNPAEWMAPGREGNKIGYFRTTRAYLHYLDAQGEERRLDLTSMISWRGHWHVVHLHGFR
ncbi:MAG: hypothetical protein KC731_43280, partial [Myxococcales bacterium]|nr:hypothetical protein [Myxococcales bacterium]